MEKTEVMGGVLEMALEYAGRGWAVFPVNNEKIPFEKGGFKLATTDMNEIEAMFYKWNNPNVAIRTGRESGFFVLDIDVKNSSDGEQSLTALEKEYGTLPKTVQVKTPSGGRHFYFKNMGQEVKCKTGIRPGIDIKGDGGYVVAPPSIVNQKKYKWSEFPDEVDIAEPPEWLLNLCKERKEPIDVAKINIIPETQRNDTLLQIGAKYYKKNQNLDELHNYLTGVNINYCKPPETPAKIKELTNYIVTNNTKEQFKINSERIQDFLAREKPPLKNLIEDILLEQGRLVVLGPDKVGKSIFILNIIRALTTDKEPNLFGMFPVNDNSTVLYLAREGGEGLNDKRIRAVFPVGDPHFHFKYLPDIDLLDESWRKALEKEIEATKAKVLILDPIRCFWSGEENDSGAVRSFCSYLDTLIEKYKIAIIITAHTPKPQKGVEASVSGSHQWSAWTDNCIRIESKVNPRTFRCVCTRDGEGFRPFRANLIKDKFIFEFAGFLKEEGEKEYSDEEVVAVFDSFKSDKVKRMDLIQRSKAMKCYQDAENYISRLVETGYAVLEDEKKRPHVYVKVQDIEVNDDKE